MILYSFILSSLTSPYFCSSLIALPFISPKRDLHDIYPRNFNEWAQHYLGMKPPQQVQVYIRKAFIQKEPFTPITIAFTTYAFFQKCILIKLWQCTHIDPHNWAAITKWSCTRNIVLEFKGVPTSNCGIWLLQFVRKNCFILVKISWLLDSKRSTSPMLLT